MAAVQEANGSFVELQDLENNNFPSEQLLHVATEQVRITTLKISNDISQILSFGCAQEACADLNSVNIIMHVI